MAKIDSYARPPSDLQPNVTFIDGYVLQFDNMGNHRLVNTITGDASDWTIDSDLSILDDRLVATGSAWANRLPIQKLVKFENQTTPV